ncbi:MAG: alginate export family protein [Chthoniobacterales bacterium]|nr:alginate export family protein [Chthoniobacterales bacterium]
MIFDLEERIRAESRENNRDFDSSAHDDNDDSWLLNRFRLGLAFRPVTWLKLYGQTQDSREAFSDRANVPGIRGAEGDDIFDLRQAYISLGDIKRFPLLLTVGRQAISYGDNRLVADSKWGNFGRTFDAIRLRF